jgi:hypothetical protein
MVRIAEINPMPARSSCRPGPDLLPVWQRAPTEAEDIAVRERKPRRTTKLCDDVKTVGINMNQRKK